MTSKKEKKKKDAEEELPDLPLKPSLLNAFGLEPELLKDAQSKKKSVNITISQVADILPPHLLQEYEQQAPGFGEKFFNNWDKNQELRRDIAREQSRKDCKTSSSIDFAVRVTAVTVFILIAGALALSAYMIYLGHVKETMGLLGGLAGLGIFGNWLSKKK